MNKTYVEFRDRVHARRELPHSDHKQIGSRDWDEWLRHYILQMIVYGYERGLRGAELRAHVDRERRYAVARHNVHWAKTSDELLKHNRRDADYDSAWMHSRLSELDEQ